MRNASNVEMAWWGILLAVGIGAVLSILLPEKAPRRFLARLARVLTDPPLPRLALVGALTATVLSVIVGLTVFRGLPTLVDGMVARLQARTLASGLLALNLPDPRAAWLIPNTLLTPEGWVSQYPPLPALLLAAGEKIGTPWLVFPALLGMTVLLTILLAGRLMGEAHPATRMGAVLLAVSPFLLFLGGGYLSHVPATAFVALALYAAHRAFTGGWGWALMVGVGSGAAVSCRPLPGLLLAVILPAAWWTLTGARTRGARWLLGRLAGAVVGGLPFAVTLAAYNRLFFGSWSRLGYSAAFGPAHDLGFHVDPWGNLYSPLEALGFTAVDLTGLGAYLFETPIPITALVGLALLLGLRLGTGGRVLLAWALLPVVGNFFYWHHGFHLGPRMLYEGAPAWVLLTALAALALAEGDSGGEGGRSRLAWSNLALWSLLVSLAGGVLLVANRISEYRWKPETLARITVPPIPGGDRALVFVHGSWGERISSRLQASGMRLDSIETALQRNDICSLHVYAAAREREARGELSMPPDPSGLDFRPDAEVPGSLEAVYLTEGNRILVDPRRPVPESCRREARADSRGIISLAPLLWQGDLPGLEEGRPMFVRDLGPDENRRVMEALPERHPWLLLTPLPEARPELRDYREGMDLIWGTDPSAPAPGNPSTIQGEERG